MKTYMLYTAMVIGSDKNSLITSLFFYLWFNAPVNSYGHVVMVS